MPLLRGYKQIPALITALLGFERFKFLKDSDGLALSYVMQAPVSTALWIEQFAPGLKDKPVLRLLVTGEGSAEALHEGIWYQLLPWLLNRPQLKVEVTLLATESDKHFPEQLWLATLAETASGQFKAASRVESSLKNYIRTQQKPDLVMMFHPDFTESFIGAAGVEVAMGEAAKVRTWFDAGQLAPALEKGVPIGVASHELSQYEHERWVLSAFGVYSNVGVIENPYCTKGRAYKLPGPPSQWGNVLWRIDPESRYVPATLANSTIAAALEFCAFTHSIGLEFKERLDCWNIGRSATFDWLEHGTSEAVYLLPLGFAAKTSDGKVFRLTRGSVLRELAPECSVTVPTEQLLSWPTIPAFPFERVLWASRVFKSLRERVPGGCLNEKPLEWYEADMTRIAFSEDYVEKRGQLRGSLERLQNQDRETGTQSDESIRAQLLWGLLKYHQQKWGAADALLKSVKALRAISPELTTELVKAGQAMLEKEADEQTGLAMLKHLHERDIPAATIAYAAAILSSGDQTELSSKAFSMLQEIADDSRYARAYRAHALFVMGDAYRHGSRDALDVMQAVKCLTKAFDQGYQAAGGLLGKYWEEGAHRPPEPDESKTRDKAVHYYRTAARAGNVDAQHGLSMFLTNWPDLEEYFGEAMYWLEQAALAGDERAQEIFALGDLTQFQVD